MEQLMTGITKQLMNIIDEALVLNGRTKLWRNQTRLYNNIPELDAMSVVNILLAIEINFGVFIDYGDFNAEVFATIESLTVYVNQQLSNSNEFVEIS